MRILFPLLLLAKLANAQNVVEIHGSGTTNPSKCYWHLMDMIMDRAKLPTRLTYRAVGSTTGIAEFKGDGTNIFLPLNHFGSGDIPISTADYNELLAASVEIVHLPVVLGSISFFHSVPGVPQGDLDLTSCLIARILKRDITDWMHPDILADNPNLRELVGKDSLPIQVAHRVEGSSSTASITEYLHDSCPDEWPESLVGSTIEWESDTLPCQGSGGMTICIRDNEGTLGYIESGHGHDEGLIEIELQNKQGRFLSSLESASNGGIGGAAENALIPASADADFGNVTLLNQLGDYTWPIVALSYVYVRKDLGLFLDAAQQGLLRAFLESLYREEYIGNCRDLFGFVPVPEDVRQLGLDAINDLLIYSADAPTFSFEVNTTIYAGQGDFVISEKRRSNSELERSTLATDLGVLQVETQDYRIRIASLTQTVAELQAQLDSMSDTPSNNNQQQSASSVRFFTEQDAQQLQAALVLSAISFALWGVVGIIMIFRMFMKK